MLEKLAHKQVLVLLTIDMIDVITSNLWIVGLLPAKRQLIADAVRECLWLGISGTINVFCKL